MVAVEVVEVFGTVAVVAFAVDIDNIVVAVVPSSFDIDNMLELVAFELAVDLFVEVVDFVVGLV